MTDGQRAGAGTLTILLAVLTLVLARDSLPVLEFLFGRLETFAALPLFAPVIVAAVVGTVAPMWLPYLLPAKWPAHRTLRVTRIFGAGIAFVTVVWKYPNVVGAQFGLFAASMAVVGYTVLSESLYRRLPNAQPPSLIDAPKTPADGA